MGGPPSKGTKADKRLKENKPRMPAKQMKNMAATGKMKGKS